MNRSDAALRADAAQPTLADLEHYEQEARRLRAEYARDLSVRLAIGLELLLRRAAARLSLAFARETTPCR